MCVESGLAETAPQVTPGVSTDLLSTPICSLFSFHLFQGEDLLLGRGDAPFQFYSHNDLWSIAFVGDLACAHNIRKTKRESPNSTVILENNKAPLKLWSPAM